MSERELAEAIREAETTGQWSEALDLIRTGLVEPLTRERDRLREALRKYGRHTRACDVTTGRVAWDAQTGKATSTPGCSCGFNAALGDTPDE
jgi:hypothetical protein